MTDLRQIPSVHTSNHLQRTHLKTFCYHRRSTSTVSQQTYGLSTTSVPPYLVCSSSRVLGLLSVTINDFPRRSADYSMDRRSFNSPTLGRNSPNYFQHLEPLVDNHHILTVNGSMDHQWLPRSSVLHLFQHSLQCFYSVRFSYNK